MCPACAALLPRSCSSPSAHTHGGLSPYGASRVALAGRVCLIGAQTANHSHTVQRDRVLPPPCMDATVTALGQRLDPGSGPTRDMLRGGRGTVARAAVCRASSGVSNHGGGVYAAGTHEGAWERNTDSTASTSGGWGCVGRAPLMTRAHCAAAAAPIPVRASRPRHRANMALASSSYGLNQAGADCRRMTRCWSG